MTTPVQKAYPVSEVLGWIGAIEVLLAFALNALGVIDVGLIYLTLNTTGAFFLSLISFRKRAWQPLSLNVIWAIVGLVGIVRVLFQ